MWPFSHQVLAQEGDQFSRPHIYIKRSTCNLPPKRWTFFNIPNCDIDYGLFELSGSFFHFLQPPSRAGHTSGSDFRLSSSPFCRYCDASIQTQLFKRHQQQQLWFFIIQLGTFWFESRSSQWTWTYQSVLEVEVGQAVVGYRICRFGELLIVK